MKKTEWAIAEIKAMMKADRIDAKTAAMLIALIESQQAVIDFQDKEISDLQNLIELLHENRKD